MARLRFAQQRHPGIDDVDLRMMNRAIELGPRGRDVATRSRSAAVIYRGDEIVAEAANNREATGDPTGHAELVALRGRGRLGTLATRRLLDRRHPRTLSDVCRRPRERPLRAAGVRGVRPEGRRVLLVVRHSHRPASEPSRRDDGGIEEERCALNCCVPSSAADAAERRRAG